MKMYKSGEREGCNVYVGDTSCLNMNYMMLAHQKLPYNQTDSINDPVEFDITRMSEKIFVGKLADWLWDNCFNCWTFIERSRQNALHQWWSDFILRFDAESDAKKFQEFYNKGCRL